MFSELGEYLNQRPYDITPQTICSNNEFRPAYPQGLFNTLLCMEVATIFYYMEGLNKHGTAQSSTDPGERELRNYLRCMIGTWTLMRLHGNKCNIREITKHVSTFMGTLAEGFNAATNRHKCAWVKFEELKIGTRLMGEAMEQWVTQWKSRRPKIPQGIRARGCDQVGGGRMRAGSGEGDGPSNNIDILKSENLDTVAAWIEKKEYLPKASVSDIMVKVGNSQNTQQGKKILDDAINTWDQERNKISSNAAETSSTPAAPSGGSEHGNQDASTNTSGQQPQAGRRPPAAPPHPDEKEKSKKADATTNGKKQQGENDQGDKKAREKADQTGVSSAPTTSTNAQTPSAPAPKGRSETSGADTRVPTLPPVPQPPLAAPPPAPSHPIPSVVTNQGAGDTTTGTGDPGTPGRGTNETTSRDTSTGTATGNVQKCTQLEDAGEDPVFECPERELQDTGSVHVPDEVDDLIGNGPMGVHGASRSIEVSEGTSVTAPVLPPGTNNAQSGKEERTKNKIK
ncbi:hypothetical protein AK88_01861 [Plasmodium fragile]|uniref:Schizont-infected cell agglutination extracellular alpha domain-containing protein n=1 Tax=Plasmodium fragile TaxID=5857 RepID=A0A0D9QMY1_PLAFR|nr:uncharacterized protein AK88_01861 [Plasmodium fragile]KJP88409.1 hypothetical protein AK88_01861 [Plasmodium fragile]